MHQRRSPADDSGTEGWHWLVDAIAEEIAAGVPHDPKTLIARLAARQNAEPFAHYLDAMFTDPE